MAVDRSEIPAWVDAYVGVPWRVHGRGFDGADCWGLVRLALSSRFGVALPAYLAGYEGASREDLADIARLIARQKSDWTAVAEGTAGAAAALGAERPGDVLLLRQWGLPCHVGLVVAPGWMLHVEAGTDGVTAEYDGLAWRHRVVGVYRHALLA